MGWDSQASPVQRVLELREVLVGGVQEVGQVAGLVPVVGRQVAVVLRVRALAVGVARAQPVVPPAGVAARVGGEGQGVQEVGAVHRGEGGVVGVDASQPLQLLHPPLPPPLVN